MNDITGKISLYHNLFIGCLIAALICLIIAVVLFFALDIRYAAGYLSGRLAKKRIRELEAETAVSGRLMQGQRGNMQYVAQKMKDDMGVRQRAKPGIRTVENAVETATAVTEEQIHDPSTELLMAGDDGATDILKENLLYTEDVVVQQDSTAYLSEGSTAVGKFLVIREIMLIHTEEVI